MNLASGDKQAPTCPKCGMVKMSADNKWVCPNSCGMEQPKTGQTVIIHEPLGKDGPVKIAKVGQEGQQVQAQPVFTPEQVEAEIQRRTNTVLLHVPVALFPELVIWARKLKLPKDWSQAAKIKAITDFQVELNTKLEDLSK